MLPTCLANARKVSIQFLLPLASVIIFGLAAAPSAHAQATITVNSPLQVVNPGPGGPGVGGNADSLCQLSEAIRAANTDLAVDGCAAGSVAGPDTIIVPADTYTLALVDFIEAGGPSSPLEDQPYGLPRIVSTIIITGVTAANTIIERSTAPGTPTFGFLEIHLVGTLTVNNLTFRNGNQTFVGGAIFNANGGAAALTINNCVFDSNTASNGSGGAIANGATINNSTFTNNTATSSGGAIDLGTSSFLPAPPALIITNSTFSSNNSTSNGGAIFSGGGSGGGNGTVTISHSVFTNNNSGGCGGALLLFATGTASIDASIFSGNQSGGGGAIASGCSSGGAAGSVTISNSAFVNNQTIGGQGGAIFSNGSSLTVSNSTFSGNAVGSGHGSAINTSAQTSLNNVTIVNNSAASVFGEGIFVDGTLSYSNTIIAGNPPADTTDQSGSVTSLGFNLIGNNTSSGTGSGFPTVASDQAGTGANPIDPDVSLLGANGGTIMAGSNVGGQTPQVVPTHALLIGSPALNAGNPAAPSGIPPACAVSSANGLVRPQGAACDIGAFENPSGTAIVPNVDVSITKSDSPNPVAVNNNLTYTITVSNAGPDPATGLSLSDALATGVNFASITSPTGWSCTTPAVGANGTVSCNKASLAPSTNSVITLVVTPTGSVTTPLSNTVTVSTTGNDTNLANNSATASTTVTGLACNISAIASGDWNTNGTWSGGVVPGATCDVSIGGAFAVTVTTSESVNSLTVTSTQPFTLSGGSLSLAAASSIGAGGFTQTSGTLTGTGTLTISGPFNWSAGTQGGGGITTADGGLNITGALFPGVTLSGRTLNNNGAAVLSTTLNTGGVLTTTINNNGTFDIQAAVFFLGSLGGTNIFNNAGTLTKSGAGTATAIETFNNTGTVNANNGVLSLRGGGTSTGVFNAVATLAFESPFSSTHTLTGTSSVTGAGTVSFTGGTTDIAGAYNVTGTTSIAGGTANFNAPASTNLLSFSGGAQGGTNTLTASGALTWAGGQLVGSGTTTANGGGSISAGGNLSQRTLNTAGTMTWSAGNFSVGSGAVWNNTGTLDITGNNSVTYNGTGATLTFNNTGTVTKSAGGGTSTIGVFFTNTGIVNANNGVLSFGTFGGAFNQTAGSTTLNGGDIGGGITFNFNGGTLAGVGTITGIVNNAGATVGPGLTPGTLTIAGNYFQGALGILNVELQSLALFDRLAITSITTLAGTLNVIPFGGYIASSSDTFQIMTYSSRTGDFGVKNGLTQGAVTFQATPQATSYLLAVASGADLGVTKTDSPDPVNVGSNLTYTVTVANAGPSSATSVVLTDPLPANVTFVSATAPCTQAAGTVTCNLGTIASGANTVITIVVTPTAAAATSISNTASVTSAVSDPNTANNSQTITTTVTPIADLAITKTDTPDPVAVASNITYTITVTNNGPSAATGVTVTDNVPANVTFVSATGSGVVTCTQVGGVITCNVGTLASGASASATVVVRTTALGTVTNTASVTTAVTDPTPGNNSATATTAVSVAPATDFSLTLVPVIREVRAGGTATYTVTLTPIPANSSFNTAIALTCFTTLTGATCAAAPASATPGSNPATSTITVTIPQGSVVPGAPRGPQPPVFHPWLLPLFGAMLAAYVLLSLRFKRLWMQRGVSLALLLLALAMAMGQSACTKAAEPPIAPYILTVTATSGSLSHSATATVNLVK